MRNINLNCNVGAELSKFASINDIEFNHHLDSDGVTLTYNILKTFTDEQGGESFYLYLFPGQGGNAEWENNNIEKLMTYVLSIKKHPRMTVVMPYLYYGGNKVKEAQEITNYIEKIVEHIEGKGSWEDHNSYKKRAVAGLCLGSLSALKCALHWENTKRSNVEKFFGVGIFSPANGGENGNWVNGRPNFKFNRPENHYLYMSYGDCDEKKCHAIRYNDYFNENKSPVNNFVKIQGGYHNWEAFKTGFADFMTNEIFAHEFYEKL